MRCSKTAVTSVCEGVSPFNQIGSHSHKECECVRTSKTLELIPVREGWGLRHIDCSEKRRVICQPQNGKEEKTFELDLSHSTANFNRALQGRIDGRPNFQLNKCLSGFH